ncbi:MAG TPA: MlaD family protein, partial [Micavibrio sp.]
LSLIAAVAFVLWIAGAHDTRAMKRYTVHFTDAVSGLKVGGVVQYKGVEVGKVINIYLDPARNDLIRVDIEVAAETPVYAGTQATLAMMGVTGMVYMDMKTEVADQAPVPAREGEEYPVIQGNGTQLAKILADVPEISKQVLEITKKVNGLLDQSNVESFNVILANVENLTRDLNGLLSTDNVDHASNALSNFSAASADMKDMVARFEKTADEVDKAVQAITNVVTKNEANINKFTQDGLEQIMRMSQETRKMAESIRRTAEKLNEDPSQLIYQPTQHGVEIPQ